MAWDIQFVDNDRMGSTTTYFRLLVYQEDENHHLDNLITSHFSANHALEFIYGDTIPDNLIGITAPGFLHTSSEME